MDLIAAGVPWFPQQYADQFYLAKGFLSLVATLLLVFHMNEEWASEMSWARRLRYLSLLFFAALLTASTVEQVHEDALVSYRNLAAILGALLLNWAAIASIRESRR
jgi:hypothetical protein